MPAQILENPPSPADVTLELLLACGSHLGHKPTKWNPANSRYIFGVRDGVHIISLDATAAHLRRAAKVVEGVAVRAGLILFVGTRRTHPATVVKAAELVGGYHVFRKWKPGTITNAEHLLRNQKLKVINEKDRDIPGFEDQLRKRAAIKPDLVICLNPRDNYPLLQECAIQGIPTIGIIDTNVDPTWVTYPIPANDDRYVQSRSNCFLQVLISHSLRCVQTIAMVLARAGEAGKKLRLAAAEQGIILGNPAGGLKPLLRQNARATRGPSSSQQDTEA